MAGERRTPLNLDRIVDGAVALIDREGLEKLTMRRLGADLGVEAMTLYHHVPSKDALLDLLVARTLEAAAPERLEPAGDWRAQLRAFAVRYRRVLLQHPGLLPLVATRPVRTPAALDRLAPAATQVLQAGFSLEQAFHLGNVLAMFVIGHALAEAGRTPGHAGAAPEAPGRVAGLAPPQAAHSHDASFEFGLDALLDGFALRLPGQA